MARADTCLAALIAAIGLPAAVQAQNAAPAGSPADVRYTPVSGTSAALYPRQDGVDDAAPAVLRSGPYAANAAVGRVRVEVDRDAVPADGQSRVTLTVTLFDRDDRPLAAKAFVTLEHSGGRIELPGARSDEFGPRALDADRAAPGVQLAVDGGQARFTLIAPHEPQDVRVRVTAGAESAAGTISFVPELRPMVAAGLLEGIVELRRQPRVEPLRRGDAFEQEIERWSRRFDGGKGSAAARAAFFLKGTVRGEWLLTAAFDSDKETRARLLRDVKPEQFYPVYGDASLRSFDARSGERLYVRVDHGKSYALYGDFVTGDGFSQALGQGAVASLKQRSLGAYNRSATGLRLHHESATVAANLFTFQDTLRQVVEEFASQGSGPYGLRNNGVLEGSEKVEVLVRDRRQPSRIVSVRPLLRLVDYGFEPFSGRILLAQFLPAVDADLNPVSLRVTYELDQGGPAFWVAGGDVQARLGTAWELGASAVEDRNELAPYRLASANATWRIGPRSALVAEVARSRAEVNTNPVNGNGSPGLAGVHGEVEGQAWRVELAHEGAGHHARAFVGRSEPEFVNPSAPLAGGRGEAQLRAGVQLAETIELYGEADRSEDRNPGGGERESAGAGLRWKAAPALTVDVGLRRWRETVGTQGNGVSSVPFGSTAGLGSAIGSGAGGGVLGYGNQALDPASGLPLVSGGGLPAALTPLPAGTRLEADTVRLGLGWRAGDRLTLGAELEHEVSGEQRRRLALGADWQWGERSRLYGRWERQHGWATLAGTSATDARTDALVFGVDTQVLRETQLFSEYRLRDALAGRDGQIASGVRQQWDLAEGWRASAALERIQAVSGTAPTASAVSLGLDYGGHALWRGSTRLELRRSGDLAATPTQDETFTTTLWQLMAARKLDRDWTLLARNHLLRTDFRDRGDILQDRAQLGLAYRDTDTNRVNALGRIEFKHESDASNAATGPLRTRAVIVSAHADWHARRPWWLSGRVAAKWQHDRLEDGVDSSFRAQLAAARLVWDFAEGWDLGLAASAQFGQQGARQFAAGAELGYLLTQNLWLSLGWNLTGYRADRDLAAYEYTQRGAYLRLRFKFDETLLQGGDPQVNRSLDRRE